MTTYATRRTADYSPLLVHFTKSRNMVRDGLMSKDHPLSVHKGTPALERLLSILQTRRIHASPMPFLPTNPPAVCFTECIWEALIGFVDRYSPYGVVVSKSLVFQKGGGPALYVRGDRLKAWIDIPPSLEAFIAPFDPTAEIQQGVPLDWLHEREWRLPESLDFDYAEVEYVIVDTIEDARQVVHQIGAQFLPESKLIAMEVYRTIRQAWSGSQP